MEKNEKKIWFVNISEISSPNNRATVLHKTVEELGTI